VFQPAAVPFKQLGLCRPTAGGGSAQKDLGFARLVCHR
jgi:hypothetical protein